MRAVEYCLDESALAWFYIAPESEVSAWCRRLLRLAYNLLGPEDWVVLQATDDQCEALCRELGLHVVQSYVNEAPGSRAVSLHIAQLS